MLIHAPTIAPGTMLGRAGYRLLCASAAARLDREAPGEAAVAGALADVALGRAPAEERAWAARLTAHRAALAHLAVERGEDPRDLGRPARLSEARDAIAWMSLPPVLGTLLMRIVRRLAPARCLELGTGFGVSTGYQAAALSLEERGRLVSLDLEGMTRIAAAGLERLGLDERVDLVGGRIEDTLAGVLADGEPVDYALLDSDHTEAGTLAAFDAVAPALAPGAVVIVDDVNWTSEMGRAWNAIAADERVHASVTLRRLGIAIGSRG